MNRTVDKYLEKRSVCGQWPLEAGNAADVRQVVVIPVLAESENVFATLASLAANGQALLDETLVIVVVNNRAPELCAPEHIKDNQETLARLREMIGGSRLRIGVVDASSSGRELDANEGVGMARRIGMDHALKVLAACNEGLIISLDGDTLVEPNYLRAIRAFFDKRTHPAAVIEYEHKLDGPTSDAITRYEIFLRYHVLGLRGAGSPCAFHTIGSAMACRGTAYAAVSGMPRRHAGEDFYFLQALAKEGPMGYVTETIVHPSSRRSWRVPFGTGRSVSRHTQDTAHLETLYNPVTYDVLGGWLRTIDSAHDSGAMLEKARSIDDELAMFLIRNKFETVWARLRSDIRDRKRFHSEFHRWFDGFRTLKLVHYLRDTRFQNVEMIQAVRDLTGIDRPTPREILLELRQLQRGE